MRRLMSRLLLLLPFVLSLTAVAQEPRAAEDLLRSYYYRSDGGLAVFEGRRLIEQKNVSLETRAWYFIQATPTTNQWFRFPIASVLDGMKKEAPNDAWTLVSQASVVPSTAERVAFCDQALAVTRNTDILVLCTDAVSNSIHFEAIGMNGDHRAVTAFLGRYRERLEATAEGLTSEALTILRLTGAKGPDTKAIEQLETLLDRALALDPRNERALLTRTRLLMRQKRFREVVDLLGPILAGGARSGQLDGIYIESINQLDIPDAEKARLIESDITRLAEKGSVGPALMQGVLKLLGKHSPEGERKVANLYIERHPNTDTAEYVMLRLIEMEREAYLDWADMPATLRKDMAEKTLAFLQRQKRSNPLVVQLANRLLEGTLVGYNDSDPAMLRSAFRLARDDFGYKFGRELLSRKLDMAEVRRICQKTIDRMMLDARDRSIEWKTLNVGRFVEAKHWGDLGGWYDTLGYADLQLGRFDEAEAKFELAKALSQNPGNDIDLQLHIGKLHQARRDFANAESYFNAALAAPWSRNTEHPAIAAFKSLFLARNKTIKGFDQYIAAANEKDRSRRRQLVLGSRIKVPTPHPAFALMTYDGKPFGSADLKGKVVLVNFWGIWCPPCIKEMPLLQKTFERYKDDPRVAIITINSRDEIGSLKSYMGRNRFSFPVLLEGEYISKVGVDTFPTTWFLDPEGRIAFEKVGVLDDLEIEWRLQNLLGGNNTGAKTTEK